MLRLCEAQQQCSLSESAVDTVNVVFHCTVNKLLAIKCLSFVEMPFVSITKQHVLL